MQNSPDGRISLSDAGVAGKNGIWYTVLTGRARPNHQSEEYIVNNIGQRIKELRKKNDLTQERLADYLGVTHKAVSKWECGMTVPDLGLIMPLAKILHTTADELLGGNDAENDAKRAEFDRLCEDSWKYDKEEMYKAAQEAVHEYPGNFKYLLWLAEMESVMKRNEESIRLGNIVIEECGDSNLRNKAIFDTMIRLINLKQYDEAKKYAEMLPGENQYTRDRAMLMCLRDNELLMHKQNMALSELCGFLQSLTEMYKFETKRTPEAEAALNMYEDILKTIFPAENYLHFHRDLCFVYEKRAIFEIADGNCDKAMEYIAVMFDHARKYTKLCDGKPHQYTAEIFNRLNIKLDIISSPRPYIFVGDPRNTKPITEQIKTALMKEEQFAPLREREDFKKLIESVS